MKTFCALLIWSCFLLSGCKQEEPVAITKYNFDIVLSGKGGLPETISKATGAFKGQYNYRTKVLSYTLTYEGLKPTAAHFHKGSSQVAGAVAVNIATTAFVTPYQYFTAPLTGLQETDLLTGQWYVNIHSAFYPNGEIRGQLVHNSME